MSQHAGPMALTQLAEDEQMFRDTVRRFATEQIGPLVRGMDESQQMDTALIKKLFDLGLMGIEIPEQYGGSGGTFFNAILAVEEISAVDPSVGVMVDVQNTLCINALVRWASDEQKKKYLPRLASDTVGSYALSEASSGSDAFALQTRAVKRGDDYVLNGQKLWITNAREAGLFIVFATLDPAAGYKGITAFLLEKGAPGFTLGKKEDKLGIRASSTCELLLEECRVPRANASRSWPGCSSGLPCSSWSCSRSSRIRPGPAGRRAAPPPRPLRSSASSLGLLESSHPPRWGHRFSGRRNVELTSPSDASCAATHALSGVCSGSAVWPASPVVGAGGWASAALRAPSAPRVPTASAAAAAAGLARSRSVSTSASTAAISTTLYS